jgi:hypothetical protein
MSKEAARRRLRLLPGAEFEIGPVRRVQPEAVGTDLGSTLQSLNELDDVRLGPRVAVRSWGCCMYW